MSKPLSIYRSLQEPSCRAISLIQLIMMQKDPDCKKNFKYVTPSLCLKAPVEQLAEQRQYEFTGIITLIVKGELVDLSYLMEKFFFSILDERKKCLYIFYDTPLRRGETIPNSISWYHEQYTMQSHNLICLLAHMPTHGKVIVQENKNSFLEYIEL